MKRCEVCDEDMYVHSEELIFFHISCWKFHFRVLVIIGVILGFLIGLSMGMAK